MSGWVDSSGMALELECVGKVYDEGGGRVVALADVSMAVRQGELVGLMGPSGCGKSTLLNLVGLIDRPTQGRIAIAGQDTRRLGDNALTRLRRGRIGFISQFFNLLPTLTLRENVELPLALLGLPGHEVHGRAGQLLAELGLGDQANAFPHQVSGGQMQRAAIARAIVHRPALVLADEPTGNLDSATGAEILAIFRQIVANRGQTMLMVTHAPEAAAICHRIVKMRDGHLVADHLPLPSPSGGSERD